jgi:hypothetical protein
MISTSTLLLRLETGRFANWKREALKVSAERSEMYLRLFNRVRTDLVRPGVRM